ncbi:MAG: DUF342 domain-containing protein [Nitrospira sp.]|nr:MAG: DUF342 domain-containing protein [Nitrospira sp.]
MALLKAKQLALEEAGTYVESYTKTINQDLSKDEIQTLAGGVLQVEVLEKTRTLVSEGLRVYLKIRAAVTTDKIEELAQRIKGKKVAEEYKDLRVKYEVLTKEISELKQTIAKPPPSTERETALNRIREREESFTELQRDETALFERLVQGDLLVAEAWNARQLSDAIIRSMLGPGVSIEIGKLKPSLLREQPGKIQVEFDVTLRISDDLSTILHKAAQERGATEEHVSVSPFQFPMDSHYPWESGSQKLGKPLLLASLFRFPDTKEIRNEWWYLRDSLKRIWLIVEFLGDGKTLGVCRIRYNSHLVPGVEPEDKKATISIVDYRIEALADEVTSSSKYFGSEAEHQKYKRLEKLVESRAKRWQEVGGGEGEVLEAKAKEVLEALAEATDRLNKLAAQPLNRWFNNHPPLLLFYDRSTLFGEGKTPFLLVMNEPSTAHAFNLKLGGSFRDAINLGFTMSERTLRELRKTTAHLVLKEAPSGYDPSALDKSLDSGSRGGCSETTTNSTNRKNDFTNK